MNFEETHMYYGLKGAFGFAGVESIYYLIYSAVMVKNADENKVADYAQVQR